MRSNCIATDTVKCILDQELFSIYSVVHYYLLISIILKGQALMMTKSSFEKCVGSGLNVGVSFMR